MAAITGIMADRVAGCESTEPAKTSRQAGHELPPVGSQAGETVSGKKQNTQRKGEANAHVDHCPF